MIDEDTNIDNLNFWKSAGLEQLFWSGLSRNQFDKHPYFKKSN